MCSYYTVHWRIHRKVWSLFNVKPWRKSRTVTSHSSVQHLPLLENHCQASCYEKDEELHNFLIADSLLEKVGLVCLQLYPPLSVYEKDKELLRAYDNLLILMSRWTVWASLPSAALIIHACFNIYTCLEACPKPKVVLHTGNGIHRTSGYGLKKKACIWIRECRVGNSSIWTV